MAFRDSYKFHESLEPFSAFIRREWKAIAILGGLFAAASVAVVLAVDPAYFYPRMQTDPLRYLLKAHALMEIGTTDARAAINLPPFLYASAPGVMRIPILAAFPDFDDQLRAIQLTNIIFVFAVALMSAYVLSWAVPKKYHWATVGFSFAFAALAPWWTANVIYPLADAPYAAFSLGALIVVLRILTSRESLVAQWRWVLWFGLLFVAAFLIRFTAPVILLYAAALAYGRWSDARISARAWLLGAALPVAIVALLVWLNREVIFDRYLMDQMWFIRNADDRLLALNPFGAAIPSQIVPGFYLIYRRPPVIPAMDIAFGTTRADQLVLAVALVISLAVLAGMWKTRRRFLPEILYVIAPFPVLEVIAPSAARYLASYQPFFWIFFLGAVGAFVTPHFGRLKGRTALIAASAAAVALVALASVRLGRVVGTANPSSAVSVSKAPAYIAGVAGPFRDLRNFLETLPKDRTLLIGAPTTRGRWTVISGLKYYAPDSGLTAVAKTKDVYLVSECGTLELCRDFPKWTRDLEHEINVNGHFRIDSLFARRTSSAQVAVYRVTPEVQ